MRREFAQRLICHASSPANDVVHRAILQRLDNPVIQDAPKDGPLRDPELQKRVHPDFECLGRGP
jgi:hypothetical protein